MNQLSANDFSVPQTGLALVAEGGGQRGIFTAGILDSWQQAGFNPFDLYIGVSAGAQNLSSYISGQPGYAFRAITEWTRSKPFYNPMNWFKGQPIMNLDWYFDQVSYQSNELDTKTAEARLANRKLYFAAASLGKLNTCLLDPTVNGWVPSLKATSAIPLLYHKGVEINGEMLFDGGVTAPLPVKQAYELGARKIVAIRTATTTHAGISQWSKPLKQLFCSQDSCPKALEIVNAHERYYQQSMQFLAQPPADAEVISISPPEPLQSKMLGSSDNALQSDYEMGLAVGKQLLASVH